MPHSSGFKLHTIQPVDVALIARTRTAIDSHFDPGHALIALLLLVGSFFAYTKLVSNAKK